MLEGGGSLAAATSDLRVRVPSALVDDRLPDLLDFAVYRKILTDPVKAPCDDALPSPLRPRQLPLVQAKPSGGEVVTSLAHESVIVKRLHVLLVTFLLWPSIVAGQELSIEAFTGWFAPTRNLASPNPEYALSARHGALESGPLIAISATADLPDPIPQLRLSVRYLLESDLLLKEPTATRSLGAASMVAALLEARFVAVRAGPFGAHVALGGGMIRYEFPTIEDPELSPLFEDGATSPAVSVALGGSYDVGPFEVTADVADVISTFDSPPVSSRASPGETVDIDEVQHDIQVTLGFRIGILP